MRTKAICLAGRLLVVSHQKFRLPAAKARYPHLPNSRSTTREEGNDFHGWLYIQMEGLAPLMVKPLLAGALSLARLREEYMSCLAQLSQLEHISCMQGPESTPTTPLNSRVLLRRCFFWGPMARLPEIESRAFSLIPNTLPASAWARLQSCAEHRERVCGPCCRTWYLWLCVE